ncbi:VENN motif pre-toxin domain-containing protein [Ursidibacter arcticus]
MNRLQADYDKEYGTGSKTKQAVDAVTAVLQGLATKDLGQAAVGLASPYLNEQIKHYTTNADGSINTEANLLAHALLGAVEAVATGNNALAGAVAGAGGEAVAMVITNTLYPNKTSDQLTEAEKKNITFLSQLAGGLASGLVGDSIQAVASGADIAKRAVENNYLSASQIKSWLNNYDKADNEDKEAELISHLNNVDKRQTEQALATGITKEQLEREEASLRALQQDPACLERCQSLAVYSINQLQHLQQDYDGLLRGKALEAGVGFATGYGALGAGKVALKLPGVQNYLSSLPYKEKIVGASLSMGANAGYQQYKNGEIKASDVLWAGGTAFASSGTSFIKMNAINAGSATTKAYLEGEDPAIAGAASIISSSLGYVGGKFIESGSNRIVNRDYYKDKTQFDYVPIQHPNYPFISTYRKLSPVPPILGNAGDSIFSGVVEDKSKVLLEQHKNKMDDKR